MNRTEQTMLRAAMDFCCADADVQCAKNHCMGVRGDLRGCSVLVVLGSSPQRFAFNGGRAGFSALGGRAGRRGLSRGVHLGGR